MLFLTLHSFFLAEKLLLGRVAGKLRDSPPLGSAAQAGGCSSSEGASRLCKGKVGSWLGAGGEALLAWATLHAGALLVAGSALVTLGYTCIERYEQFLLPYIVTTVAVFVLLARRVWRCARNDGTRAVGLVGFAMMSLATLSWVVEKHTCRDWLKLHACWHLGVGFATYLLTAFIAVEINPGGGKAVPLSVYVPCSILRRAGKLQQGAAAAAAALLEKGVTDEQRVALTAVAKEACMQQ